MESVIAGAKEQLLGVFAALALGPFQRALTALIIFIVAVREEEEEK